MSNRETSNIQNIMIKKGGKNSTWPTTSYFSLLCVLKEPVIINQPIKKNVLSSRVCFRVIWTLATQVLPLNQHIWRGLSSVYVCVCSFCSAKRKYDNVHGTQAGVQYKRTPSVSTAGERHSTCARAQRLTHIPSILPPLEPAVKTFLSGSDDVKVTELCYFQSTTLPWVGD